MFNSQFTRLNYAIHVDGTIAVPMMESFAESAGSGEVCAVLSTDTGDITQDNITITLSTSDDTGELTDVI